MSEKIQSLVESEYKYFHAHPEVSYHEFETTKRIKDVLTSHDIEVLDLDLKTGLIAKIGHGPRVIALRADIDALPVNETTSLEYKSVNQGVMHACGHDSHISALIGAALLLKEHEDKLNGTIKLIFQPAEEAPGGAQEIIDTHELDEIEAIFGIHCDPRHEVGELAISAGPTHAAVEKFKIIFTGKGSHAAHPEEGVDALYMASAFVNAVQSIVSRNIAPDSPAVVSVTHLEAGTTWNVIPETALVEGTIRTYKAQSRKIAKERIIQIATGIASTFNGKADFSWEIELGSTNNDPALAEFSSKVAKDNGFKVAKAIPSTGGEDFALYQELKRGQFILFGSGASYPPHNPKFCVDIKSIYKVSQYLDALAIAYFNQAKI